MLSINIKESEKYNEDTNEFFIIPGTTLQLEHSLYSIALWESKWKKPFLSQDKKTLEETLDYIKCMTLNSGVNPMVYFSITPEQLKEIEDYIHATLTATTFSKNGNERHSREIITNEIVYYWMLKLEIPFECDRWHFSRLMTLIEVCNRKDAPAKKMNKKDLANRNRSLNAARRAKTGSRG